MNVIRFETERTRSDAIATSSLHAVKLPVPEKFMAAFDSTTNGEKANVSSRHDVYPLCLFLLI